MASAINPPSAKALNGATAAARFEETQRMAEAAGLPRYETWCATLEQRYTVMPPWYWDSRKRRAAYGAQVAATRECQRKQAQINDGTRRFFGNLYEPR